MEADELEQRIRATQRIVEAMAESCEDCRPLLDTLIPATEFMTREEVIETLKRVCAAFDQKTLDSIAARVHHEHVEKNLQRELELAKSDNTALKDSLAAKECQLAAKDRELAARDEEIKSLKAALADSRHSEESLREEKYAGKSKRGLGKSRSTSRGRDDNKDDFDGTPESAPQTDANEASEGRSGDEIPVSLTQIRKAKASRPSKYTLADAAEKVVHECDLSRLPKGAVLIPGSETTETIFSEERIIRADIYKFVKYRILEPLTDENGNPVTDVEGNVVMVWKEHTMHFPKKKGDGAAETACAPMKRGHLPQQVPGTHETPAMLANLMFEHYFCNVPMNRISKAFGEFGFKVGRSTLEKLDSTVAGLLRPAYAALQDDILCDDAVIFCDETWGRLHLMDATRKVYYWIVGNKKKKGVVYVYDDGSRGRKVIVSILEGRDVKAVHTDGYNAYYFLSDIGIVHICCGAHVWRKIKEWYDRTGDPEARVLLLELAELFMMDARLRELGAPPEEVLRQRNSPKTLDTISRFTARIDLLLEKCKEIPKIGFKALNYAKEVASKVFRWREDPDYELDNNFAEQSARPFATARKTSLFHCSHEGAGNDCVIRSFIETCRLRGVSVTGWFKAYFNAILNGRTDYSNLLPGVLALD